MHPHTPTPHTRTNQPGHKLQNDKTVPFKDNDFIPFEFLSELVALLHNLPTLPYPSYPPSYAPVSTYYIANPTLPAYLSTYLHTRHYRTTPVSYHFVGDHIRMEVLRKETDAVRFGVCWSLPLRHVVGIGCVRFAGMVSLPLYRTRHIGLDTCDMCAEAGGRSAVKNALRSLRRPFLHAAVCVPQEGKQLDPPVFKQLSLAWEMQKRCVHSCVGADAPAQAIASDDSRRKRVVTK